MDDTDAKRTIVVTGAARGMGAAIAERAIADGYRVVAVDRDPSVARFSGPAAEAHTLDVTDAQAAADVIATAVSRDDDVYGLINVAGIHRRGNAITASDEDWTTVLSVNLYGTVTWTRAILPRLVAAGRGSIVNFASVAATHGRPDSVAYVTSKTAVLGFTRSVAMDFGPAGIRCNAISPGSIDTPMIREAEAAGGTSLQEQASAAPLHRLGTTNEIAGAVMFLLSDDGGYVNGANLPVDGGRTAIT